MFNGENGLKVAIYVKEFSRKESELFSDKNQMRICQEFIKIHKEWIMFKEYHDEYSKKINLPQLEKLLTDGEERQLDWVITSEAERFGKDVEAAYQNSKKLLGLGIGVIFIKDDINTKELIGMMKLGIMSQMSKSKKQLQSERIKEGLKKKRTEVISRN